MKELIEDIIEDVAEGRITKAEGKKRVGKVFAARLVERVVEKEPYWIGPGPPMWPVRDRTTPFWKIDCTGDTNPDIVKTTTTGGFTICAS